MRNLVTATGRKQHIVREGAYHGRDGQMFNALCGAWPKEDGIGAPLQDVQAPVRRRCAMKIFLLWDNSRAEKGEGPTLVDVYASFELAAEQIAYEEDLDPEMAIEERKVVE